MSRANRSQTTSTTARALREFLSTEAAGGGVLLLATVVALVWANSPWRASYDDVWHTMLGIELGSSGLRLDLKHWVNDGLMAIFFLVVALEVKRELLQGELKDRRRAALPVAAALGGMLVPAAIYLVFNPGPPGRPGWGIAMATDIAFAVGVLALVAPRAPSSLRLFLLTLAIVDDIGAIVVIALFYSDGLDLSWAAAAVVIVLVVALCRRIGYSAPPLYVMLGLGLWLAVHGSGAHATLAGVIMGLMVPATPALTRDIVSSRGSELLDVFSPAAARSTSRLARQSVSELEWLEHAIHPLTSLAIVPIFALANAGVALSRDVILDAATAPVTLGIVFGLVLGKTIGITGGAWLACRAGIADMGPELRWRDIVGVAALGGIGFTVSLFIAQLAFEDEALIGDAKVGILAASVLATAVGALLLRTAGSAQSSEPAASSR